MKNILSALGLVLALASATPANAAEESIVLAGGCFWGIQGVYEHVAGVFQAVSGYAGGAKETAEYGKVSTGATGHAESVKVTFDPARVSLDKLLDVFFTVAHNPTEVNRQGPDVGTQYRSAIFYTDEAQKQAVEAAIQRLEAAKKFPRPIATKVDPLAASGFYPAEGYHQDYLVRHPESFYIVINDLPKIARLKNQMPDIYREDPILVAAAH